MSKLKNYFEEKIVPNIDKFTNARYVKIIMTASSI